ncbi:class I SAM-dependent methyltransferase [Streptomyces sp. NPDC056831]|uniref:class I SAM-dependent methyltransferase n=1 Tax=Streptomyces sp. NPDC056831 TaxID=3345954 RepID=UPI00367E10F8
MPAAFADLVAAACGGRVGDLGCGPGRVAARVRDLGPTAFGIGLSPGVIAVARRAHPDLTFDEGSMTALDLADGSLAGALAWYSLVHTPPEQLPADADGGARCAPGEVGLAGTAAHTRTPPVPARMINVGLHRSLRRIEHLHSPAGR